MTRFVPILLAFLLVIFGSSCSDMPQTDGTDQPQCSDALPGPSDSAVLSHVLASVGTGDNYRIVKPTTDCLPCPADSSSQEEFIRNLQVAFEETDSSTVRRLVRALLARNRTSEKLPLPSSKKQGYLIDHDYVYGGYYESGADGEAWPERDRPASGLARVSLPAFDVESRLTMVFVDVFGIPLGGEGWIAIYKCSDTGFQEVDHALLWIG